MTDNSHRFSGRNYFWRGVSASLLLCAVLSSSLASAKSHEKLSPQYKQWLERDAAYLITREEKDSFMQMETDLDRDKAIEQFWEVRNPNPGAPLNEYKEEVYKRIAYANEHYGTPGADNGWHTDRGRAYIVLGPPQQMAPYYQAQQTKPMEIWFYQNVNPALPPYFYLIFYQKDIGDEYRLYSPYFDGPDKLTTTVNAVNDRRRALDLIDRELGREVSRTTLSLIPDEPVDYAGATSTMDSDLMLAVFKNLANHPLTKEKLRRNRDLLTNVSHRVIIGDDYVSILTTTLRDASGNTNLHYLVRMLKPTDFAVGKSADSYYYSVQMNTKVMDEQGKLVLTDQKDLSKYLTADQFAAMKDKCFGYEGVLPLIPGKYKIEFLLSNKLAQTGYQAARDVVVPEPAATGLRVSDLIQFSKAEQIGQQSAVVPFSVAGVKFMPQVGEQQSLIAGQDLNIMYQLWAPPADPRSHTGQKLQVEYTFGRPGVSGDSKSFKKEEVSREQFDSHGSLTSGTKLSTTDLPAGNYRLVVTVIEPETQQKVFASTNFRVSDATQAAPAWDVYDEDAAKATQKGVPESQRALLYLSKGEPDHALTWLQTAVSKNPSDEDVRSRLATIYFEKANYAGVVALYPNANVTRATDESAALHLADSLAKTGQTKKAAEVIEAVLSMRSPSAPLYAALASYYDLAGNSEKATEARNKGKTLMK